MAKRHLTPDDEMGRLLEHRLQTVTVPAGEVCADAETLASYVDDGMSVTERAEWEAHFATCAKCRRSLALMARLKESASPADEGSRDPTSTRNLWVWLPLAACVLVGAGLYFATRPLEPGFVASARPEPAATVALGGEQAPAPALQKQSPAPPAPPASTAEPARALKDEERRAAPAAGVVGGTVSVDGSLRSEAAKADAGRAGKLAEGDKAAAPAAAAPAGRVAGTGAGAGAGTFRAAEEPAAPAPKPSTPTSDDRFAAGLRQQQSAQAQGQTQTQAQTQTSPSGPSAQQAPQSAAANRRDGPADQSPRQKQAATQETQTASATQAAPTLKQAAPTQAAPTQAAPGQAAPARPAPTPESQPHREAVLAAKAPPPPPVAASAPAPTPAPGVPQGQPGGVPGGVSAGLTPGTPTSTTAVNAGAGAAGGADAKVAKQADVDAVSASAAKEKTNAANNAPAAAAAGGAGQSTAKTATRENGADSNAVNVATAAATGSNVNNVAVNTKAGGPTNAANAGNAATGVNAAPAEVATEAKARKREAGNERDLISPAERSAGLIVMVSDPATAARRWRVFKFGRIEVTRDGGGTWTNEMPQLSVTFADGVSPAPGVCWVVGTKGGVWHLAPDAGTTGSAWQQRSIPTGEDLVSVTATSARDAVVVARSGQRYITSDGGKSWTRQ